MQRLTDLLGQSVGGTIRGGVYAADCEQAEKPLRTEDALYTVTIIAPVSVVMLDGDKAVIRVEVLARSEQQAIHKAGVSVKRG